MSEKTKNELDEPEPPEMQPEDVWMSATQAQRRFVYEALYEQIAKLEAEQAAHKIDATVVTVGHLGHVSADLANAIAAEAAVKIARAVQRQEALTAAVTALEELDEELCPDCNQFHQPAAPHVDPKSVS